LHTPIRKLALPATLLSAAALTLGLLTPVAASAQGAGRSDRSAQRAEREQLRAARAEERAARAAERRAGREQERATRRAAREAERSARRGARHGGTGEQAIDQGAGQTATGGETEGVKAPVKPTPPAHPATPAASAELKGCRATIEASSSLITAGETVTIFGKLTCPTGVSAAERQISVSEGEQGTVPAAASVLGVATTEADGSYKIVSPALETNTAFRVRVGNRNARAVVKVAPLVTLSGPSPSAVLSTVGGHPLGRSSRVAFSGTVKPGDPGGRVSLQVAYAASGEQWRTVRFGSVGADGSYSVTHRFRIAGQASVRVLVHVHGHKVVAASETLTYEVALAQNPKLTILSSADPVTYGQPIAISGVAAEAPEQTVTLLAHTHGASFAPVATTTTDGSGNYSFPEAPTQSTYYRVSIGATRSTALYEGVKRALTADPLPAAEQAGQPITFSGTVTPADEGQTVYVERENASGVGFHVVASSTIGASGYSITRTFANAGSYTMRIRVPGDPALQATTSALFSFEVAPAAASVLTPEAPVPASAGAA
jgi:hypothetical protein